jgi:hypothetical protein
MPLGLSDTQLATLMTIAGDIPPEKRSMFLERVGAMLAFRGRGHFDDGDVAEIAALASTGLACRPAA